MQMHIKVNKNSIVKKYTTLLRGKGLNCVCVCVRARVCVRAHLWLQVGYLYDRLLIDCLILHNRRKGYLSVCARAMENERDGMCVCMCSFHNG